MVEGINHRNNNNDYVVIMVTYWHESDLGGPLLVDGWILIASHWSIATCMHEIIESFIDSQHTTRAASFLTGRHTQYVRTHYFTTLFHALFSIPSLVLFSFLFAL